MVRTHDFLGIIARSKDMFSRLQLCTYHELNQPYTIGEIFDKRRHRRIVICLQLGVQPGT